MGLNVDINGNVTGTIELEDGDLLAGKHIIEIEGSSGTKAKGLYVNDPSASITDLRQTYISGSTDAFSPIAQTFSINEERDLIAVELDINASSGDDDVVVQIREVDNGFPSQEKILAEGRVSAASINPIGTFTRFNMNPPVPLLTDREYAIMVLTQNVDYTISISELGGIDIDTGNAIASQPNAGVLLTSSNGSTWTPEQGRDLKFKLIAAKYAVTEKTINLGNVAATDITDFMVMARTEISDKDSLVKFEITDPDSVSYVVDNNQVKSMTAKKTGNFNVKATLVGNSKKSPILYPNLELVLGEIKATGVYHSIGFKVPDSFDATVIIDAKTTGSANYQPAIEDTTVGNYVDLVLDSTQTLRDGYVRSTWKISSITEVDNLNISSVRITANSPTALSRIYMRNLIVYTN
jgi:hypothetical protein